MEMTGAQILMEALLREKVERVFGYAGATICPAVDVLRATPSTLNRWLWASRTTPPFPASQSLSTAATAWWSRWKSS